MTVLSPVTRDDERHGGPLGVPVTLLALCPGSFVVVLMACYLTLTSMTVSIVVRGSSIAALRANLSRFPNPTQLRTYIRHMTRHG